MLRFLGLIAAIFALPSSSILTADLSPTKKTPPTPYFIDNNIITRVVCGNAIGTGFYVEANLIATAYHVVSHGACESDGVPATVVHVGQNGQDFALIRVSRQSDMRAIINCGGLKEDGHYFATGFAEGAEHSVTQRLLGSGSRNEEKGSFSGLTIFRGSITQGQSGGPINDEDGAVVAIINANTDDGVTISEGLSLSETILCKK